MPVRRSLAASATSPSTDSRLLTVKFITAVISDNAGAQGDRRCRPQAVALAHGRARTGMTYPSVSWQVERRIDASAAGVMSGLRTDIRCIYR